jgi:uncharacterized protein YxeA
MKKSLIIGIVVVVLVISTILIFAKKSTNQNAPSNSNMQGMDMNMTGMDHSKMQMGQ